MQNYRARKTTKKKTMRGVAKSSTAAAGANAVSLWPSFEILTKTKPTQARKFVESAYGKSFASKASDRLCQALGVVQQFALESAAPRPRPTILEFAPPEIKENDVANRAMMLGGPESKSAPGLLRIAKRELLRDQFARQVAGIRTHLERKTQPIFHAGLEAIASPTTPSSVVQICWLNGTLQTYVDPRQLRAIADERTLTDLDLPRPLTAEIDGTAELVGAPGFRTKFSLNLNHITVAVIDGEIDISHPALKDRVVQKANFTNEHWGSPHPHGTAVAGMIASIDKRFEGMAPGVTITNYKVLATNPQLNGTDFGGALAIQQALEDGAQIANCSWGAGPAGDGSSREARACDTAWSLGLVLVKSAGNNGPGKCTLTSPADADGIIVVGATDRAGGMVQDYSSRGPTGTKTRPHLVAPGGSEIDNMHSSLVAGGFGDVGYGTSYAAPHVSGLVALLLAQTPGLEPDQVRSKLISCCKKLPNGDMNTQGKGLVSLAKLK